MTGGLKPEYYTRKRILKCLIFDQVLNGLKMTHNMYLPSYIEYSFMKIKTPYINVQTISNYWNNCSFSDEK